MSFRSIKDPEERDDMVKDYLATVKRIKKRNSAENSRIMEQTQDLETTFEPVVRSNREMAQGIAKDLAPITQGLQEINRNMVKTEEERPKIGAKCRMVTSGPQVELFIQSYLDGHTGVDRTFGIHHENGMWMIGDKPVEFQGDDIVIDGEVYPGTLGFWSLVTAKNPKDYSSEDYERYKELLHETDVLYRNNDPQSSYPRTSRSKKWTTLLHPIWEEFQRDGLVSDDDDFRSTAGDGIDPIPGCKIYMQKKGRCFNVRTVGNGIHFSPRPLMAGMHGDHGLFLRVGSSVYDGRGLLLGPQSPFRNIPILGWVL